MLFKLNICKPCAAKLRAILQERGEEHMAEAIPATLCTPCLERMPGYAPGRRLTVNLKRTPLKPEGIG